MVTVAVVFALGFALQCTRLLASAVVAQAPTKASIIKNAKYLFMLN
jgi:hypothetical protein